MRYFVIDELDNSNSNTRNDGYKKPGSVKGHPGEVPGDLLPMVVGYVVQGSQRFD